MSLATIKRSTRSWLSGHPRLLQAVFRTLGKPHKEIAVFRSLIRPGDTVLDIGANTGQYTGLFCHLVGPEGSVHAFEPVPPTFSILKKNLERHSKECRLVVNDRALGDSEGTIKMFVSSGRFTEASMVKHALPLAGETKEYDCRVTTADRYARENDLRVVDLIKCDVEGAELPALKGALGLLKSKHPPLIFLEAWDGWTADFGYHPADLFDFLKREAGYEFYHVDRAGLRKFSVNDRLPPEAFPDFLNFLCIVPSFHKDRFLSLERAGLVVLN